MKEYLRKQIIDALYSYASNTAEPAVEHAVKDTWNVEGIENIINNASDSQLRSDGAPIILVTNWCVEGIDELLILEDYPTRRLASYYNDCYNNGVQQLRNALTKNDVDAFFDWYEDNILRPSGFTVDEVSHLYEAIELCCMRLCRELRSVSLRRRLSRADMLIPFARKSF